MPTKAMNRCGFQAEIRRSKTASLLFSEATCGIRPATIMRKINYLLRSLGMTMMQPDTRDYSHCTEIPMACFQVH